MLFRTITEKVTIKKVTKIWLPKVLKVKRQKEITIMITITTKVRRKPLLFSTPRSKKQQKLIKIMKTMQIKMMMPMTKLIERNLKHLQLL